MDIQRLTPILSYLKMFNLKANHCKIIITDQDETLVALVTSANPHDGSSAHGNVAVKFNGLAVQELLTTEKAVLAFSKASKPQIDLLQKPQDANSTVQVVTERAIKESILQTLNRTEEKDSINLVIFYLSDRDIIEALKQAHTRGVSVKILLDPNKDAFGHDKNGIPNRQVAYELHQAGIPIRWCDTHGEQCHAKMLIVHHYDQSTVILGSANFTRRNLENFNLETNIAVRESKKAQFCQEAQAYFDRLWNNTPEQHFSVEYKKYEDESLFKRGLYRFMEASGVSTF